MKSGNQIEVEWKKAVTTKNQRLLRWFFVLLLFYPLGCFYTASQRENVREAAVRELGNRSLDTVLFLSGADASDDFLQRFQNDAFTVRKASQAIDKGEPIELARHRVYSMPLREDAACKSAFPMCVGSILCKQK